MASVRAGNVIGGGDWADDRIVPDCVRALSAGQSVAVRNPDAVRPWQSVLDPLAGYLWLGAGSDRVTRLRRGLELRPRRWRRPDRAGGRRGRGGGMGRRRLAGGRRRRRRAARSRSTEARRRQGGGAARLARGLRCAARHRSRRELVQSVLRGRRRRMLPALPRRHRRVRRGGPRPRPCLGRRGASGADAGAAAGRRAAP